MVYFLPFEPINSSPIPHTAVAHVLNIGCAQRTAFIIQIFCAEGDGWPTTTHLGCVIVSADLHPNAYLLANQWSMSITNYASATHHHLFEV